MRECGCFRYRAQRTKMLTPMFAVPLQRPSLCSSNFLERLKKDRHGFGLKVSGATRFLSLPACVAAAIAPGKKARPARSICASYVLP